MLSEAERKSVFLAIDQAVDRFRQKADNPAVDKATFVIMATDFCCGPMARHVVDALSETPLVPYGRFTFQSVLQCHYVAFDSVSQLYFDAECFWGVADPRDLPYLKRCEVIGGYKGPRSRMKVAEDVRADFIQDFEKKHAIWRSNYQSA